MNLLNKLLSIFKREELSQEDVVYEELTDHDEAELSIIERVKQFGSVMNHDKARIYATIEYETAAYRKKHGLSLDV